MTDSTILKIFIYFKDSDGYERFISEEYDEFLDAFQAFHDIEDFISSCWRISITYCTLSYNSHVLLKRCFE